MAMQESLLGSLAALERQLETMQLCSSNSPWTLASYFMFPICRSRKPQVWRYEGKGGLPDKRRALCDLRPSWLFGKCRKSTATEKYLGHFGTADECEAACLSYSVGHSRCRAVTYHYDSHRDRKLRRSCFSITDLSLMKRRDPSACTGRVFGPVESLLRSLVVFIARKG
mmetsp:Transcript_8511/g.19664  ORF Transcript_8511/g.19664 Transcript_8511/m.19664 type:complete len:169 (-) Transcript_8511:26-532(-)